MFLSVLGFLSGLGPLIGHVTDDITNLKMKRIQTESDEEKKVIDAQIDEAHARQSVLVAEAWNRVNAMMRAAIAFGPMTYILKYFFFDKVIGSFFGHACFKNECSIFNTDSISADMWKIVVAVIAFYFVYDMAATYRKKV